MSGRVIGDSKLYIVWLGKVLLPFRGVFRNTRPLDLVWHKKPQEGSRENAFEDHWKEMSLQDSDEVSFHDASAYFSEEEWTLLQEWQKELYRNVMKEIHQALISLGPLITTTVFSLRAKEMKDMYHIANQEPERKRGINCQPSSAITNFDEVFRIKKEENLDLNLPRDSEGREKNRYLSAEPFSLFIAEEIRENATIPISGHDIISFQLKDERETFCIDEQDITRTVSISPTVPDIMPFCIKDEKETYCIQDQDSMRTGNQHSMRTENINSSQDPAGDGSMNKQNKCTEIILCNTETAPSNSLVRKTNTNVWLSAHTGTNSRRHLPSEMYMEQNQEETPCKSNFSNFNLFQGRPKVGISQKCKYRDSNERTSALLKGVLKKQKNLPSNTCTEFDKRFSLTEEAVKHMGEHSGVKPHACTICAKSFHFNAHLIKHYRTHTGEKPFMCTVCHKQYSRKDHLKRHMRMHTGERPYKCTECGKSFTWKESLNLHLRRHTEDGLISGKVKKINR
ncbi:zinc finger protein 773-like isoform X2 [Ambystoma mexicanum]|uniref:zinc finger protein 773-like isoform X2 n=1 Tax=Ambystoma mexicanum TaxID=8296 RepID=UPI0037E98560